MDITIDDDTFHRWATEKGYVLKADVQRVLDVPRKTITPIWDASEQIGLNLLASNGNATTPHSFLEEATALENLVDLKPAPTREQVTAAVQSMIAHYAATLKDKQAALPAGRALLAKLGAPSLPGIPSEKFAECMELLKDLPPTMDEFIARMK